MTKTIMPPAIEGRNVHTQQVSFIRRYLHAGSKELEDISFASLPERALILRCNILVFMPFKTKTNVKKAGEEPPASFTLKLKKLNEAQTLFAFDLSKEGLHEYKPQSELSSLILYDTALYLDWGDAVPESGIAEIVLEFVTNR